MRHDDRHDAPAKAGDSGSEASDLPAETTAAESVGSDTAPPLDYSGEDLQWPSGGKPFRFRGRLPALEQGLASREDLAPLESPAGDPLQVAEFDLPLVNEGGELDLAAELAQDLERLREAADGIASTSDWVEQHSAETTTLETKERVESLRRRRAPAPATSPAMVGPRVATRGENTAEKQDAAPEAEHQERVPMKTTAGKRAADVPHRNRTEEQPVTADAGPAADSRSRSVMPPSQIPDADEHDETSPLSAASLEAELKETRETLQRLRERAALQTRMYGSVGAQTRKLDQRAAELRARVAKAQEALNERARNLQGALERERERLRAYHAKLQQRARELSDWTQTRRAKLGDEVATQRAALEVEKAALARREAELERQFAAVSDTERQGIEAVRAELEQAYQVRLAEVERQREKKLADLEARETALLRRETEQAGRLQAFEESRKASEEALRTKSTQLDELIAQEQVRLSQETGVLRKELEENAERRQGELNRMGELLAAREAAVHRGEEQIDRLKQTLDAEAKHVAERAAEFDRRDADLARISAAMEVRERRLQEWQARVEQTEGRLETLRSDLEKEALAAQAVADENLARSATLKAQLEELQGFRTTLLGKREQIESRLEELREKKELLDGRRTEVERLKADYEEQVRLVAEERRQYADLAERSEELDRQRAETASRISEVFRQEENLKERIAVHESNVEAVARTRKDLDAVRETLAARDRAIEARETELTGRTKQLEDHERRLQQKAQELTEERSALDGLRSEYAENVALLEIAREKIARQQLLLDEAQMALQIDRQHFTEQEHGLAEAQSVLRKERDDLAADQVTLQTARSELERRTAELAREQEETAAAKSQIEADHAKLERDDVSLRDRERVLAEGRTALEVAKKEIDELRQDLARRVEETEGLRRYLTGKAARMKARKQQLAKDAAVVDQRLRTLKSELAEVADKQRDLQRERERLELDRGRFTADRQQLEEEREELEQARKTFQAGLRSLEEGRHQLAEREAQLGARTGEVDGLRKLLEDERADLQRQRQELLALQEERGDTTRNLQALMAQAEAQQVEVRRREELLHTHEQALAARSAELSRAEDELDRRRREQEALDRDLTAESETLDAKRAEFESTLESERASLEAACKQAESEFAAERGKLREQASDLETAIAAHHAAAIQDEMVVDGPPSEEARKELEAELSEQLEALARREQTVEAQCRARLEGLDRDIEQRLANLEKEIRDRREQAEGEIGERRKMQEDEFRAVRSRMDEQVEELRRRQAAAAREHALLQEERQELSNLRRRLETEGKFSSSNLLQDLDARPAENLGSGALAAERETVADHAETESPVDDARVESGVTQTEGPVELGAEDFELADNDNVLRDDDRQAPDVLEEPEASPASASLPEIAPAAAKVRRTARGSRAVRGGVLAAVVGCAVAGIYLWLPSHEVVVKGRVALNKTGSAAPLSAAEHFGRMQDPAVFEKVAEAIGVDIQAMYHDGKIGLIVAPASDAVELTARVPRSNEAKAQACLDAWGTAYQDFLNQSVISGTERQKRLSEMEAGLQKLSTDRQAAATKLEEMKAALQADSRLGQVEAAKTAKVALKARLIIARDEQEAAKATLAKFEATPLTSDAVVPTEEQLVQACAADAEVMQAIEQRDAKARELHKVLTEAMAQSQTPLSALLASINELASEVDQQLADQTDQDIRRELEQVAVDLKDYRKQAEGLFRSWDELAPKVSAWKSGGDAELLLEYQKKAEVLIREFHSQSADTSRVVGAKADAIGQGGSEMTMRRVIHGRLRKALLACQQARNDWILSARGAVPRYNLELKALTDAIRDLSPRIEQRRTHHKDKLTEHLMKVRADERSAELQRLRDKVEDSIRQYQRLSDEFVKLDAEAAGDESLRAEALQRQTQIRDQEDLLARLDKEASETQGEISRLQSSSDVSLAGSVSYKRASAVPPDRFEAPRRNMAIGLGAVACLISFVGFFMLSGFRKPSQRSSR
jgi:chromosome segregation ATPase